MGGREQGLYGFILGFLLGYGLTAGSLAVGLAAGAFCGGIAALLDRKPPDGSTEAPPPAA